MKVEIHLFKLGYQIISLAGLAMTMGCSSDPCENLCRQVSSSLNRCIAEWPVTWSDFDSTRASVYRQACEDRWYAGRSTLEGRELDDAYEQCEESSSDLSGMGELRCDYLRAIYLADPSF